MLLIRPRSLTLALPYIFGAFGENTLHALELSISSVSQSCGLSNQYLANEPLRKLTYSSPLTLPGSGPPSLTSRDSRLRIQLLVVLVTENRTLEAEKGLEKGWFNPDTEHEENVSDY